MWERELLVLSALTWKSGSSSTDETIVERMRVPWSTYSSHFSCSSRSNWNCGNTSVFFFLIQPGPVLGGASIPGSTFADATVVILMVSYLSPPVFGTCISSTVFSSLGWVAGGWLPARLKHSRWSRLCTSANLLVRSLLASVMDRNALLAKYIWWMVSSVVWVVCYRLGLASWSLVTWSL